MRLKSLHTAATNQRIKRTCVANIFMLFCLLNAEVWSYVNIKNHRFVRQLNAETAVNNKYMDMDTDTETDTATTYLYHQPHFTENRSVIVQLFEWKFLDIATECRKFLGPQGYAGVQVSPTLEHTVIKSSDLKHPWWERYEVVSYRLASRSGDESDFWSMSRICNDHGVRIYADVLLNHMAAPLNFVGVTNEKASEDFIVNTLLETNVNISQLNYSNVSYTQSDFHRPACVVMEHAQDAHEIRNCQLNGHPDLDHSRAGVQKNIVKMLNKFIDMGVAGFRIDKAKYMWPIDLKNILKEVKNLSTEFKFKKNSRPFVYHDVFDLGLDSVSKTEYSTYGVVSEYLYPAELSTILNGRVPLSSLINWGPALGFLTHQDSLVFIDSHDTQRGLPLSLGNNHVLTYKQRLKYIMANVFMLVHPYGAIKRIMSSYYFPDTNINQGPPIEEQDDDDDGEISSPKFDEHNQCTKESGWVCEHRWPELVNMLKVANYFRIPGNKEESIIYFQTNGQNQVAFCRGQKAFVAINNDLDMDFAKEVFACLEPGFYCDMVTGGKKEGEEECHGKMLEINEQRYVNLQLAAADDVVVDYGIENEIEKEEESGKIESYGILVIYVESKITPKENTNNKDTEVLNEGTPNSNADNDDKDEEDDEDIGNPSEVEDQPEENPVEVPIEEAGEEEQEGKENTSAENVAEDAEEDKVEQNPEDDVEEGREVKDSKETDTNSDTNEKEAEVVESKEQKETDDENQKDEKSVEVEENVEDGEAEDVKKEAEDAEDKELEETDDEKTQTDEKSAEVEENVDDPAEDEDNQKEEELNEKEENVEDSKENADEAPALENDEQPEGEKSEKENLVKKDSTEKIENQAEIISDEGEIGADSPINTEQNQSRNIDENNSEPEKQVDKPVDDIADELSKVTAAPATVNAQDIQVAGIFSKPKGNGNNG